ncbi:ParB/Srx family N-terminal domain-containing protein [Paraburkholderia caffeinilytica]|uniref:ParB/Srx family N-terminal domain-containing protein n=1 Tax=Paraburkholderia caffeinilytica TaxID=1761016 RepID=UPI003DA049C1
MVFRAKADEPTRGCPTSLLEFDRTNPRLVTGDSYSTASDEDIISALNEIASLDELITSICTNKYLDLEPLIVIGEPSGPFRVLEGNRRLASIKLILDPELAKRCRISMPKPIPKKILDSIATVTVWRVKTESDAQAFIGFKHINGPHRWDAYAKARFVADWYKKEMGNGLSIDAIARQLGDDNDTIRAYIGGILVLEQAEKARLFEISNRYNKGKFAFSHLYTALGRTEYQDFLGLESGWNRSPDIDPVPRKNAEKLGEVLRYIYGSKQDEIAPLVKSQNPDLKQVGEVIAHPVALERIRAGATLALAYNDVRSPYEVFSEALGQAHLKLTQAVDTLPKYTGDASLLPIADEIVELADTLITIMKKKAKKK